MNDIELMKRALALAHRSEGHTRPNPPVGAVIAIGGEIVGEGRHVRCGLAHAEAAALADFARRAKVFRRSGEPTVYCTLEPCSKPGRVGACCDALIAAGVRRVVWAVGDPNPKNRGKAARRLRRAGIAAECWQKSREPAKRACADEAMRLIAPFAKHVTTGLPFVTVKIAMSLDGRICDQRGDARWISSASSRRFTGAMRERVDTVMVGAGTLRCDDPSLLCHTRRNDDLHRVIVTGGGALPPDARVFSDTARGRTHVCVVGSNASVRRVPKGIDVVTAPTLRDALVELGRRGFMHVLCEGGMKLATALAQDGLVDEWVTVLAPKVIGSRPIAECGALSSAPDSVSVFRFENPSPR